MEANIPSTPPASAEVSPQTTPAAVSESSQSLPSSNFFEAGGETNFVEKMGNERPLSLLTIITFGVILASAWYSIVYHRKAIQNLESSKNDNDEFQNLVDEIEEVKYNVKQALGKKYKVSQ